MNKDEVLRVRLSKEELNHLEKAATQAKQKKSVYVRKLILGYIPISNIDHELIIKLTDLWQKMHDKNINKEILKELETIILDIKI